MRRLALLLLLAACDCGDHDRQVTFGLDHTAPTPDPAPETPAIADTTGLSLPAGTTTVEVAGAALSIPAGALRAAIATDLDDDADDDALVVIETPESIALSLAQHGETGLGAPAPLATWPTPANCTLANASLTTLGGAFIAVATSLDCADGRHEALRVLTHEPSPRPGETIRVRPDPNTAATLTARASDVDSDSRADLAVDLTFGDATVTLTWIDRPAGLALKDDEPEATLTALGQQARAQLRQDAAAALAIADRARLLHAAVCRESGRARLQLGSGEGAPLGIACRASQGAGSAAFVRTLALAEAHDLAGALESLAALGDTSVRVTARDRREAAERIRRLVTVELHAAPLGITLPPVLDRVRVSRLAFESPDVLLVRSQPPQRIDLAAWRNQPPDAPPPVLPEPIAPEETSLSFTDPSRQLAVAGIVRTCAGYALSIVRTEQIVSATVIGAQVSEPLIEQAPPPPTCPALPPAVRQDTGDLVVLGWAPQGVVVARRETLFVVPLTVEGMPAGEPTRLPPGTPPPSPLRPGAISADGASHAFASPAGIVLRTANGALALTNVTGEVTDIAVDSGATRVAFVRDGQVQIATRDD